MVVWNGYFGGMPKKLEEGEAKRRAVERTREWRKKNWWLYSNQIKRRRERRQKLRQKAIE